MKLLKKRSYTAELLDAPHLPEADLIQNLKELQVINTYLGGHAISLKGFKTLCKQTTGPITVADIGCGGGDNLKYLAQWARNQNIECRFYGIDLKPDCIRYAAENCKDYPEIEWIPSDYRDVEAVFDITCSALFCHHLNDTEVQEFLNWSATHSRVGFFINDLERNPIAYYSIWVLTQLFSKSYLVKNDAPLSVARGYYMREWQHFLTQVGLKKSKIYWKWAFRHLVIWRAGRAISI